MIDLFYILNQLNEIIREDIFDLKNIYPDLKIKNIDYSNKSISIENFEFIDNGKKINNVYTKGKLEISVHPNGRKAKESNLENLIQILSIKLSLNDREPVCFYKWEYNKNHGLLKKDDRFNLSSACTISEALDKTLDDVIYKELPKFRVSSKEKTLSEDQLLKFSSFEVFTGMTD